MNDLHNDIIPVYLLILNISESSCLLNQEKSLFDVKAVTALYIYNYKVTAWEPILETISISSKLRISEYEDQKTPVIYIFNDVSHNFSVNINLSETMVIYYI